VPQERFEPKPGMVVAGKYCVERVIGEGGMGVVVSATHEGLDQKVAIKFLIPEAMRSPDVVERFLREAKVAARVTNEHVARVTDVGKAEPGGVPFIVMEYLEGSDLGAMIDAAGKLPLDEACEVGLQACEALAEVHAAGIVHRDLKPSNLFVTRRADGSPSVKLLDFGISKFATHPGEDSVDPALTATATIMGSPSYMSPEQLKSTKEVDARTDVWALGAVIYEAITGKPAFKGETVPQVCFLIGSEDPAPPSSLRPELPPEIEKAILACLDKNVETRGTLVDLARALVGTAPDRARASLERVEATMGAPPAKKPEPKKSQVSLPVVPLATSEVARTQSSWHDDRQRRRGGGGALLLLLFVVAGVFAFGVASGRIDVGAMRGRMTGATSAVSSAVASATAAIASAMPSTLPTAIPSALASAFPVTVEDSPPSSGSSAAPPPSASETPDDEDDDEAPPEPSVAVSPHPLHPYVPRRTPWRPKHPRHKNGHKKRYY
jgi:serine/threonine-protein kinase